LDFVGHHRKEFRYENRFKALVGGTRKELERNVQLGFPFLPAGCQINLDFHSQSEILESLKNSLPTQWTKMVLELRSTGDVSMKEFIEQTGLTLEDIYSNPVKCNREQLLESCKQQYQKVMNRWHNQHEQMQRARKV
jgi:hypothetical protein